MGRENEDKMIDLVNNTELLGKIFERLYIGNRFFNLHDVDNSYECDINDISEDYVFFGESYVVNKDNYYITYDVNDFTIYEINNKNVINLLSNLDTVCVSYKLFESIFKILKNIFLKGYKNGYINSKIKYCGVINE